MKNKKLELVAINDIDKDAEILSKKLYPKVKFFKKVDDLLNYQNKIDLIVIATLEDSHIFFIEKSVKSGIKTILVEKPLSNNLKEAKNIIKYCNDNEVRLIVNHMRQFDNVTNSVKDYLKGSHVKKNIFGKIKNVTATYDNGLYHGGTHIIDLLISFMGPVKSVSGNFNPHFKDKENKNDFIIDSIIEFKDCNACLFYTDSTKLVYGEITFVGEKGIMNLQNMWGMDIEIVGSKTSYEYPIHQIPDYSNITRLGGSRSYFKSTYDQIVKFLTDPKKGIRSFNNSQLKSLEVIQAIVESAKKNGLKVPIKSK